MFSVVVVTCRLQLPNTSYANRSIQCRFLDYLHRWIFLGRESGRPSVRLKCQWSGKDSKRTNSICFHQKSSTTAYSVTVTLTSIMIFVLSIHFIVKIFWYTWHPSLGQVKIDSCPYYFKLLTHWLSVWKHSSHVLVKLTWRDNIYRSVFSVFYDRKKCSLGIRVPSQLYIHMPL